MPIVPPSAADKSRVLSLTRHLPWRARYLSQENRANEIKLIAKITIANAMNSIAIPIHPNPRNRLSDSNRLIHRGKAEPIIAMAIFESFPNIPYMALIGRLVVGLARRNIAIMFWVTIKIHPINGLHFWRPVNKCHCYMLV